MNESVQESSEEFTDVLGYENIQELCEKLIAKLPVNTIKAVYGVPRGGILPAYIIANLLGVPQVTTPATIIKPLLIVDDIIDSGRTIEKYKDAEYRAVLIAKKEIEGVIVASTAKQGEWITFPWEITDNGIEGVQENIVRLLEYIGDDPSREGLLETPKRIVKSYKELFSGYKQDAKDILSKEFSTSYDQMVVLKDIEFYSFCEHHMLPFFGKASVAYLPNKKVVGISKLARLVDMFARRLQIQEQMTDQIANAIEENLKPNGVAVTITAKHFCMVMRGVSKQHSEMTTTSLRGSFLNNPETRAEFFSRI